MAVENGRWVQTRRDVKPGIVTSSLLRSSAHSSVAAVGEQRAWWMNRLYSAAVEVALTLAAIAMGRSVVGALVGMFGDGVAARGIIQSSVRVHLLVHSTVRPRYEIVHPNLPKVISHPALQSVMTEMREWDAKLGMMWARRVAAGSAGMPNVHVCIDVMRSPFGSRATIGLVIGVMLVAGANDVRKWLVAPESRIAQFSMVSMAKLMVQSRAAAARA